MNALGTLLLLLIAPASAQEPSLVFNEIAWMGTSTSANDEWLELYNATSTEVDVTGYKIVAADGAPSITLKGMVLPRGFFLLERTDDTTTPALADMLYTGALSNETETLRLYDASGNLVDEVSGWSAGDNETKQTMARDMGGWKFGVPDGTPGTTNTFSEGPAEETAPPKKQSSSNATPARIPSTPTATQTPSAVDSTPPALPIAASAIPIALKSEQRSISPVVALVGALVAACAATFFLLPKIQRKKDIDPSSPF